MRNEIQKSSLGDAVKFKFEREGREEHYKLNILLLNDSCKAAISNHLYS